jgi:hypothetical protein
MLLSGGPGGRPPGLSEAREPALARRDGERFGERRGTHRNAWFPSSLRASDPHEFGVQLWSQGLPTYRFLTPLVVEGDQEACA